MFLRSPILYWKLYGRIMYTFRLCLYSFLWRYKAENCMKMQGLCRIRVTNTIGGVCNNLLSRFVTKHDISVRFGRVSGQWWFDRIIGFTFLIEGTDFSFSSLFVQRCGILFRRFWLLGILRLKNISVKKRDECWCYIFDDV